MTKFDALAQSFGHLMHDHRDWTGQGAHHQGEKRGFRGGDIETPRTASASARGSLYN